ncbi:MAG: gfo/Idh/MocA family oxidoreductase, partial [Candidatus Latescibacterota bacterium]|nr:gfo/Idh/MocA family oxidoreductase [Candidatus Latescibacterota bacterium]
TPEPKFGTEVVGSSGRLIIDSNESATLYRGTEPEVIPAPEWPVSGIEAGVQDLVQILEQGGTESISTGRDGQAVVEVIAAILASHQAGHAPIQIPQAR